MRAPTAGGSPGNRRLRRTANRFEVGELRVMKSFSPARIWFPGRPGRGLIVAIRRKTSEADGMAAVREVRASLRNSVRQPASLQNCITEAVPAEQLPE